jgi:hypothetical protein
MFIASVGEGAMNTHTQYFCYVYDAPESTPLMFALDADSFPEAVQETRLRLLDENGDAAFAEIWDGSGEGAMTRVAGQPRSGGLLRSLRRARPSSRFSRP